MPTRGPDGDALRKTTPAFGKAVTVPAYLVIHAERQREDTLIEDPNLAVEFIDGWVLFKDRDLIKPNRVAIAIPATQVRRVERVDEPQTSGHQEPAPQKER